MAPTKIQLTEYETKSWPPETILYDDGVALWRNFDQKGKKIRVTFPSPKTAQQWQFTAQGWVGHIPVSPNLSIHLLPKVPLANIFRMWEVAYDLTQYELLHDLVGIDSLAAFYERIVLLLLQVVQKRERQGFYRAYQPKIEKRAYLQGKVLLHKSLPKPAEPAILCSFEEHTADIPENQILAYTLTQVARGRRCSPALQTAVRRMVHHLQSITSLHTFRANECWTRPYTRLNQDYEPMHALCRFLLAHQGPFLNQGEMKMQPFLINMPSLYELYVAKWIQQHLSYPWQIKVQESVSVGQDDQLRFEIDLVLYDGEGRVTAVLDTKYKTADKAANADISQVIAYAQAKGSPQAILIYPAPLKQPLQVTLHGLRLRSLTFPISGDLDEAGNQFLAHLLSANSADTENNRQDLQD